MNFKKDVLQSDIPVIVDFYADWCGPCQMMKPIFEKVGKEFEGRVKFVSVDTEQHGSIAQEYEIRSIPCLVVFKHGKELTRHVGFRPEPDLKKEAEALIS